MNQSITYIEFEEYLSDLEFLWYITIPCALSSNSYSKIIWIYDSSESAVYIYKFLRNSLRKMHLLYAKSQVDPLKTISLPFGIL